MHGMEQGHRLLAKHFSVYSMLLINGNTIHRRCILKGRHTGNGIRKYDGIRTENMANINVMNDM